MIRKNQKGFTLVELIIAVAILAIVTLAVCGFIVVGSRSYTSANTDIMLQQEAQLALNQISDVIIDTTDSISYSVGTGDSLQNVLKDSEYGGEATDKCLVVVNRNDASSNNRNPSYWFYWSKADEAIYFNEVTVDSTMTADEIQAGFDSADTDKAVLAEHVTDLNIDISQFEENRVVMISMVLKNGNREYSTSNNVTVRNKIALNVVDINPMKRADEFKIETVSFVTLEPGESYPLTATVTTSSSDDAIKWEFADSVAGDTTLTPDGYLTIGKSELNSSFYVRVIRLNEEYTGQNDRVSKRVKVNVKRVTFVSDDELTAAPGDTVELSNAAIRGHNLGEYCFGIGCSGSDDVYLLDKDSWKITSNAGIATIESPGDKKATIKISPSAKEGDVIVVEAASLRSSNSPKGLGYGPEGSPTVAPVKGEWKIRIVKGIMGSATPMPSGFQVGTDNPDVGDQVLSWLKNGMTYTAPEYAIYARVKDVNGNEPDRVIIYYGGLGENIRFYPDMFGLEWNRSYKLYLQAIVPMPIEAIEEARKGAQGNLDISGYWNHQYDDDIVDQIINHPENLDSIGRYIGTKYDVGEYFEGTLNPPMVSVSIGGVVEYPNADPNIYEKYSLLTGGDRAMEKMQIGNNINIKKNTIETKGMIKFTFYKNEGGNWVRVAGYNPNTLSYDDGSHSTSGFSFAKGVFDVSPTGDPFIMRRGSSSDYPDACGDYRIVVGYEYQNEAYLSERSAQYTFLYPKNYPNTGWDYKLHYYEVPDCVVPWKVDMSGVNLRLLRTDGTESWAIFPLPIESKFPFALRTGGLQVTTVDWLSLYTASGEYKDGLSNIQISCQYYPATSSQAEYYKIILYTEQRNGATYKRHVYGEYKWESGMTMWEFQSGEGNDDGTNDTNIEITRDGVTYLADVPTLSDLGLSSGDKKTVTVTLYEKNGSKVLYNVKIDAEYAGSNSVKLGAVERTGHKQVTYEYGTYTWDSANKNWTGPTGNISKNENAVSVIKISGLNWGQTYNVEVPIPGDNGFPGDNGTLGIKIGYPASDIYCAAVNDWEKAGINVTAAYSKVSDNTWKVTLTNNSPGYGENPNLGTWTWTSGDVNWH